MLNTLQQHLRNVRSVISRSYNVHQCHPKVLMVFFWGGGRCPARSRLIPRPYFHSSEVLFFLVGFCCQLKKQPHSIEQAKMQIVGGLGKKTM